MEGCKFTKNRLQHRRFSMNIASFLRAICLERTPSSGCFWYWNVIQWFLVSNIIIWSGQDIFTRYLQTTQTRKICRPDLVVLCFWKYMHLLLTYFYMIRIKKQNVFLWLGRYFLNVSFFWQYCQGTYLETQKSIWSIFAKIVNDLQLLPIFAKRLHHR